MYLGESELGKRSSRWRAKNRALMPAGVVPGAIQEVEVLGEEETNSCKGSRRGGGAEGELRVVEARQCRSRWRWRGWGKRMQGAV